MAVLGLERKAFEGSYSPSPLLTLSCILKWGLAELLSSLGWAGIHHLPPRPACRGCWVTGPAWSLATGVLLKCLLFNPSPEPPSLSLDTPRAASGAPTAQLSKSTDSFVGTLPTNQIVSSCLPVRFFLSITQPAPKTGSKKHPSCFPSLRVLLPAAAAPGIHVPPSQCPNCHGGAGRAGEAPFPKHRPLVWSMQGQPQISRSAFPGGKALLQGRSVLLRLNTLVSANGCLCFISPYFRPLFYTRVFPKPGPRGYHE